MNIINKSVRNRYTLEQLLSKVSFLCPGFNFDNSLKTRRDINNKIQNVSKIRLTHTQSFVSVEVQILFFVYTDSIVHKRWWTFNFVSLTHYYWGDHICARDHTGVLYKMFTHKCVMRIIKIVNFCCPLLNCYRC